MDDESPPEEVRVDRMVERALERHLPQVLARLETDRRETDAGSSLTAAGSKLRRDGPFLSLRG